MGFQPKPSAVVILNVCPEPALREARAKILRNAGYVPASAGTAEEAASLATSVICSGAIICYSFKPDQRCLIQSQIEEILPATKIVQLNSDQKNDPLVVLSSLRDVLGESNYVNIA
jgi:agmatine/peptidylarginine deiminase